MIRGVSREGVAGEQSIRLSRLEEAYVRHADATMRLAYLLTGDPSVAEDVVQDAFVRVFRHLLHLRSPDALDAYLKKTVVNLVNSRFRRLRIERAYMQRQVGMAQLHVEAPDIDDRDTLTAALMRLPPRQRTAIVLRFYEDLSERQAAEVMNCRPGTVKALTHQGMNSLRGWLSDG